MDIIQSIHGYWRWILALSAIVLIVKYLAGFVTGAKFVALDQTIGRIFSSVMTVQFVLGLIVIIGKIVLGGFNPRLHMEHAFTGIVAVALSHAAPMFKRRDSRMRFLGGLILALLSILIAVYNVGSVRGNWFYN